jgi:hypothetical protein
MNRLTAYNLNSALRATAERGFIIAAVLIFASPVLGCPMCKDSSVDSDKPAAAASAGLDFNKSIYVMLGGFVSVVGFSGRVMYKAVKQPR